MENPIKMDDLGVPLFLETPIYIYIQIYATSLKPHPSGVRWIHITPVDHPLVDREIDRDDPHILRMEMARQARGLQKNGRECWGMFGLTQGIQENLLV